MGHRKWFPQVSDPRKREEAGSQNASYDLVSEVTHVVSVSIPFVISELLSTTHSQGRIRPHFWRVCQIICEHILNHHEKEVMAYELSFWHTKFEGPVKIHISSRGTYGAQKRKWGWKYKLVRLLDLHLWAWMRLLKKKVQREIRKNNQRVRNANPEIAT